MGMNRYIQLLSVSLLLITVSCKEQPVPGDVDNLFEFKDYISYHTQGNRSVSTTVDVVLAQFLDRYEIDQELPGDMLQIRPKVSGSLIIENGRKIVFRPAQPLEPDTEYVVTLSLEKLYGDLEKEFQEFTFAFKTLAPNFKITLGTLQSHSREWQYLSGTLDASDLLDASKIGSVLKAKQGDRELPVTWDNTDRDAQYYSFTIDSIAREAQDSALEISWRGKALGVENEGSESFDIPGLDKFEIVGAKTVSAPNAVLSLNFSEPLDPGQDLKGLVTIEKAQDLRFKIQGNLLHVYPVTRLLGEVKVQAHAGIKSAYGHTLKQAFSELVSFEPLKPAVRLISKGTILPNAKSTPIYFETVNLAAVEVRVIQVFKDNMLQYLQQYNLDPDYDPDLRPVGKRVAYKLLPLNEGGRENSNYWKAHALDLSELIQVKPGSLYRVELSFGMQHSTYGCGGAAGEGAAPLDFDRELPETEALERQYWNNEIYSWRTYDYHWEERENPCHPAYYNADRVVATNLLGSDLGLIVKKGNDGSHHFAVTDLLTTKPEANATIKLFNFQQQPLGELQTDASGLAVHYGKDQAAFAVASKGNQYAYAKLADGNALSMSSFEISGEELQKGLQGFIYTERGVHRPGEPIHLTFVLDDSANPLPPEHPVTLEVSDARGKLVQRQVLTQGTVQVSGDLFAKKQGKFHYFPIPTQADAPTGNWTARILVGGAVFTKSLKLATVKPNRLKVDLAFDQEVLRANVANKGEAKAQWLHGAPARHLKIDINASLAQAHQAFPRYRDYEFQDPVRQFSPVELQWVSATLDADGRLPIQEKIDVNGRAPGMLQVSFNTKVFEGGGDFSLDVFSKLLAPYPYFVGLASPKAELYGSFMTDRDNRFELVSVDENGRPAAGRKLQVQVFKIAWRWWWNRGGDNLSRYENATVHRPFQELEVTSGQDGKASFNINIPDEAGGRFLIRAIDPASGHATGRTAYFYRDWWKRPDGDSESSKILVFSSDKDNYKLGEEARIRFPSNAGGRALVSIENGTKVLSQKWIETTEGETTFSIPIREDMAPNAYINISLLQPHGQQTNDLPIRLYGVVPLLVEDPATRLQPQISMPEVLEPEKGYKIGVAEANKKPMTYTLAVVDQGLLDLTRFKTPDIHGAFYAKQALGVKTFDIFDQVMGAYSVSVDNIYAIGGGGVGVDAKNQKAQRFKPVVTFLGPFDLKAGEKATHILDMPNYVGSVRAMVIAGNAHSAYGHVENSSPVRKPLMVLTSLPRKLSPGETVTVPVTVFAMEPKVRNVRVTIEGSDALEPLGETTKTIAFQKVGEQIVNFDFRVNPTTDIQTIKVAVSGAGEQAHSETQIDVENPNPTTTKSETFTLGPKGSLDIPLEVFGSSGTNGASLEFSTLPPMDFTKHLDRLLRYPHGCVEQITSVAFPQLFLADVMDLTFDRKKQVEQNIRVAINALGNFQGPDGGLSYWPGSGRADDWGTTYAGHFMLEAKGKGHQLPLTFLSNWLKYQKSIARAWSYQGTAYNSDISQAYRLYTLALAGQPELAAMNRLRESPKLSNEAKWRLAAAYALIGKKEVAQELVRTANLDFQPRDYDYLTYGTVFRNRAMALETLVILADSRQPQLSRSLAGNLASQNGYSTQETAYALLALSKMVLASGGKAIDLGYGHNGKTTTVKTDRALALRELSIPTASEAITVRNNRDNTVYVTLVQTGKLPVGQEMALGRNLDISVVYKDPLGHPMEVSQLRQGTEFQADITVFNATNDRLQNLALTHIVPSGWEIVDTSIATGNGPKASGADHVDIRDDRSHIYFGLGGKKSKTFSIKLNASYLGEYYLPGAQVEAMYDNDHQARSHGQWIKVVK